MCYYSKEVWKVVTSIHGLEQLNSVLKDPSSFHLLSQVLSVLALSSRLFPCFPIAATWLLLLRKAICHTTQTRFYIASVGVYSHAFLFSDTCRVRSLIWEGSMGKRHKTIFEETLSICAKTQNDLWRDFGHLCIFEYINGKHMYAKWQVYAPKSWNMWGFRVWFTSLNP